MSRLLRYFLLVLFLGAIAAVGVVLLRAPDPYYAVQEWVYRPRFWQYDQMIARSGERYGVDPKLVKAIVWRESRFEVQMVGTSGERGLMQVTEAAGQDWAKAEKIETFTGTDLFDPKTNLDAGTWYIARAISHWKEKDVPVVFGLAEYNAGRRRVDRWITESKQGEAVTAESFLGVMDFPTTRRYIEEVTRRYRFYQERGRL